MLLGIGDKGSVCPIINRISAFLSMWGLAERTIGPQAQSHLILKTTLGGLLTLRITLYALVVRLFGLLLVGFVRVLNSINKR